MNWFHRPLENHVSVIYRYGRFHRLLAPHQWTFLFFEEVRKEVSMDTRTAVILLTDVLTRDQVFVDIELKVFFSVDLRRITDPARLLQAVRFPVEEAFEQIVRTHTNDVIKNVVFPSRDFAELNSVRGRAWMKEHLSRVIGERVIGFGIVVGAFGVNIVDLKPNAKQVDALKDQSAALTLGEADMARIMPSLRMAANTPREVALINSMLLLVATAAKHGKIPELVLPEENSAGSGDGDGIGHRHPLRPRPQAPANNERPFGGMSTD